jgi:hypothetical protein
MEIHREQVLEFLRNRGDADRAKQAEELPDPVDTDRDAAMLHELGVEPSELLAGLGGGDLPGA